MNEDVLAALRAALQSQMGLQGQGFDAQPFAPLAPIPQAPAQYLLHHYMPDAQGQMRMVSGYTALPPDQLGRYDGTAAQTAANMRNLFGPARVRVNPASYGERQPNLVGVRPGSPRSPYYYGGGEPQAGGLAPGRRGTGIGARYQPRNPTRKAIDWVLTHGGRY